jgi:hypothetical protein
MGGEGIVVPNHPGARGESLAELRRRDVVRKRAAGPRTADFRSREVNGISASHRSRRSGPREWTSTTGGLETGKTKKNCVSPCLVSGSVFSLVLLSNITVSPVVFAATPRSHAIVN